VLEAKLVLVMDRNMIGNELVTSCHPPFWARRGLHQFPFVSANSLQSGEECASRGPSKQLQRLVFFSGRLFFSTPPLRFLGFLADFAVSRN